MSGCECKTGFFTLRACEKSVVGRCYTCKRAMCRDHAVPASTTQCLDCLAKEKRARQSPTPNRGSKVTSRGTAHTTTHDGDYDENWLYERRQRVRDTAATGTVGGGAVASHHASGGAFDEQDVRAFDDLDVERDDDFNASSGFGDS